MSPGARSLAALLAFVTVLPCPGPAQVALSGRTVVPRGPGPDALLPLGGILCFASRPGPGHEARSFRTWETQPAGWWRIEGAAGNYTLLFTQPAHFFRPAILNNLFTRPGDQIDGFRIAPRLDFGRFHEGAWDAKAGSRYFQTFVARGRSVTSVGFRLAHDGVDGAGPGAQELMVSLHRRGPGTPDQWPTVGPVRPVLQVDCGGPKNPVWCAGWNSGEVPLTPGETYAVQLRSARPEGVFQPFWQADEDLAADCYRIGATGKGWQHHDLWLAVATDDDGLLLPCNKRVQREFGPFAGSARTWSQSYVAQGRSLAGVLLYAAVSGAQPPLSRQRTVVRLREGGPRGPVVGVEKIAIGNGNYTGDASWGRFGVVYAPDEVPVTPGRTYTLEWESLETPATIGGFTNIKAQVSDGRPAFNPYRKHPREDDPPHTSYRGGTEAMDFNLDLQVIEYEHPGPDWSRQLTASNLLPQGAAGDDPTAPLPGWTSYARNPATRHAALTDAEGARFARVAAAPGGTMEGGYVRQVTGLSRLETYRLSGRLRTSWPADWQRAAQVGVDPSGQTNNPAAQTILWLPPADLHGTWLPFATDPIRPATNSLSLWLHGRATAAGDRWAPFQADFDDLRLQAVRTSPPGPR